MSTLNDQFKDLKLVETFRVLDDGTYDKQLDFERDIQPFVKDKSDQFVLKMKALHTDFNELEK